MLFNISLYHQYNRYTFDYQYETHTLLFEIQVFAENYRYCTKKPFFEHEERLGIW